MKRIAPSERMECGLARSKQFPVLAKTLGLDPGVGIDLQVRIAHPS